MTRRQQTAQLELGGVISEHEEREISRPEGGELQFSEAGNFVLTLETLRCAYKIKPPLDNIWLS